METHQKICLPRWVFSSSYGLRKAKVVTVSAKWLRVKRLSICYHLLHSNMCLPARLFTNLQLSYATGMNIGL